MTPPVIGPMPAKTKNIRAFSLIEAAIVLGVIGLVIGGLWAAASTVRFKMQVNEITKAVVSTYQNMLTYKPNGTFWCATPEMDILPRDWLSNGSYSGPFGAGINACRQLDGKTSITIYAGPDTDTFSRACAYFVPQIINTNASAFDHAVFTYDDAMGSISSTQLPVSPEAAQGLCNTIGYLDVQLFFK